MSTRNFTSRIGVIYLFLLLTAIVLSIICIFSNYKKPFDAKKTVISEPLSAELVSRTPNSAYYTVSAKELLKKGGALGIYIDHWEMTVLADGESIYSRAESRSIFGNTTGSSWNIITIPADSNRLEIYLSSRHNEKFNHNIKIVCGTPLNLYHTILIGSIPQMILSLIATGIGLFMFLNWVFVIRMSEKGSYIPYFAIFSIAIGIWTMLVSDFILLEVQNYIAVYFIGHICLMAISFPLIMFTKRFYKLNNSPLFTVLSIFTLMIPVINILLQFSGVRELRQQLPFTHLGIVLAMIYMIYAIIRASIGNKLTRSMQLSVAGLMIFFAGNIFTLTKYYTVFDSTFTIPIAFMMLFCVFTWFAISIESHAIMVENHDIQLYKQLAEKDILTGLANRNCYEKTCRTTPASGNMCVITLDLNNLKTINDTRGHADGDKIIRASADFISAVFSKTGLCFRIGGDEFCIITRNSSEETIRKQISRLRTFESQYNYMYKDTPLYMAAGYAFYDPSTDKDIEDIRKRADQEMYADKRRSKNHSSKNNVQPAVL
ncbi:diguanylate cyclase (GGDEF) domain-containing protein [Lachnospiraceae bacterium]|nr:diguanylate cyclase (GGDEF) domain-containing protein [Lachnospiraceae bacterium]